MLITPNFRVILRVYAEESDLDFSKVKETLSLSPPGEFVDSAFADDDQEIGAIKFRGTGPVHAQRSDQAASGEHPREFVSATAWLGSKSPAQFDELRKMGLGFDLFIEGYVGIIPVGLIHELSRLGLSLWIGAARSEESFVR